MSCRSRSGWRGKGQRGGGDQSGEKKRLERQVESERGVAGRLCEEGAEAAGQGRGGQRRQRV